MRRLNTAWKQVRDSEIRECFLAVHPVEPLKKRTCVVIEQIAHEDADRPSIRAYRLRDEFGEELLGRSVWRCQASTYVLVVTIVRPSA